MQAAIHKYRNALEGIRQFPGGISSPSEPLPNQLHAFAEGDLPPENKNPDPSRMAAR